MLVRRPEWAVDRLHLPVPGWIVGVFDPAQVYLERSRPRPPGGKHRRRPPRGLASYAPLTSDGRLPREWDKSVTALPPPEIEGRLRRLADERAARAAEVLAAQGLVLDAAVQELLDHGTTVIAIPPAVLSARIVSFRWGDSVLEIDVCSGANTGVTSGSRTRLGRQGAGEQAGILRRYLGHQLAGLAAGRP